MASNLAMASNLVAYANIAVFPRASCEVNRKEKWFNLMLIAHTQKCIVIPKKKALTWTALLTLRDGSTLKGG